MAQGEAAWIYRKVLRHPLLSAFLRDCGADGERVRVGWGYRPSGRAAMNAAGHGGGRLLLLEDAFLRSIRPGDGAAVYGLIADSQGIHYDAGGKSDLVAALNTGTVSGWMRGDLAGNEDPAVLMARFREIGASKYNWFPGEYLDEPLPENPEFWWSIKPGATWRSAMVD